MKLLIIAKILIVLFILWQITQVLVASDDQQVATAQSVKNGTKSSSSDSEFDFSAQSLTKAWKNRLQLVMPAEHATFAYLLVFGGSLSQFSEERKEDILTSGLAHVVAASGMNVAFVLVLSRMWRKSHRISQVVLSSALVLGYAYLAGWSVPIVRAALGVILVLIGKKIWLRQVNLLYLLCASAALQLLFAPELIISLSFQLSYLASIGLLALFPLLSASRDSRLKMSSLHLECTNNKGLTSSLASYLKATIQVTFCCWLLVTPVLAFSFGTFSLTTFVSAVLTAWLVPILFLMASAALLVGGIAVTSPGWIVIQQLVLQLLMVLQNLFFDMTHMVAQLQLLQWQWLPTFRQLFVWYGLVVLVWYWWSHRRSTKNCQSPLSHVLVKNQLITSPC